MKSFALLALTTIALIVGTCLCVCDDPWSYLCDHALLIAGSTLLATSFSGGFGVQDANQSSTLALPSATNTAVTTATGLDTMASTISDFLALSEVLITAPAVNTTQLPNAATLTYALVASNNSNMSGPVTIDSAALIQTGAGGTGAAAATERFRLPTNLGGAYGRYLGLTITPISAGNCAAANSKLQMLF